ncbi:YafY family protein [Aliikangiella sp. G2MR2-5]|uniref:helix-turn-helix transcriptional regulator n=1 Tax=Aliikangiella sp. G2MR2-5 TaxID=2788943 RepID=UPI0018AA3767|nr:YafY family protein [Aliikangiella sp. G2MR2-5]
MRRADRLFQITQILRNKRLVTAAQLAERLEVSERTIYRDIQDLSLSGVPIESEAGVGYMLRHSLDIPPIMFNPDELEAIVLGVKMITAWSGNKLDKAAKSALEKIEAVVPRELQSNIESSKLFVPTFAIPNSHKDNFEKLRQAINKKCIVLITYRKLDDQVSQRKLWPLGMYYWGKVWTMVAWCELREAFRAFRVDRIESLQETGNNYQEIDGRSLDDYIAIQKALYQQHKEWDENQNYGQ